MVSSHRATPSQERDTPRAPSPEASVVPIPDDAERYALMARSKKLARTAAKCRLDIESAQLRLKDEQQDFQQQCAMVASKLGLDVADRAHRIVFDDEAGQFRVTSSGATATEPRADRRGDR